PLTVRKGVAEVDAPHRVIRILLEIERPGWALVSTDGLIIGLDELRRVALVPFALLRLTGDLAALRREKRRVLGVRHLALIHAVVAAVRGRQAHERRSGEAGRASRGERLLDRRVFGRRDVGVGVGAGVVWRWLRGDRIGLGAGD